MSGPPVLVVFGARNVGRAVAADRLAAGWSVLAVARSDATLDALHAAHPGVTTLRGDAVVGRRRKQGFCFFDTEKVGGAAGPTPRDERYRAASCGGRRSRGLTTGLSVGWADRYHWTLPDQFIDVTGLPAGVYRLRATADHPGLFAESDEHDNVAWSDVRITRRGGVARARVVARGGGRL